MVAWMPVISLTLGFLAVSIQVLKPRLPTYRFQIIKLPLVSWINGKLRTRLGADVRLRNDNYIPIDVHALSFDLYYHDYWAPTSPSMQPPEHGSFSSSSTSSSRLALIGHIQDKVQAGAERGTSFSKTSTPSSSTQTIGPPPGTPKEEKFFILSMSKPVSTKTSPTTKATTKGKDHSSGSSLVSTNSASSATSTTDPTSYPPLLWALSPRQAFETIDEVILLPHGTLGAMSSLSWDWMEQGGVLDIPSSGVIQIKANKNLRLTMNILCENVLDTWTMEMKGLSCTLHSMDVGWKDMTTAVQELREYALTHLNSTPRKHRQEQQESETDSETSTTGPSSAEFTISSLDDELQKLTKRLEWRKALPMLAL